MKTFFFISRVEVYWENDDWRDKSERERERETEEEEVERGLKSEFEGHWDIKVFPKKLEFLDFSGK